MRAAALLVVVVILGVGAYLVLGATDDTADQVLAPAPAGSGATGTTSTPRADPIGEAGAAACGADRQVLEQALETYRTLEGHYADVATLVAAGFLREASTSWAVRSDDDFVTYRLEPLLPACVTP